MATPSKRLETVMNELMMIYVETQQPLTLKKKMINREKAGILVNEASDLLDALQLEISKLDETNVNASHTSDLNKYVDLLTKNSNFDETLYVVNMLRSISSGVPTTTEVTDNVEHEVIYEECEINDF